MKLTFLGTGPTTRVTTGDGRTRSSLYVQSEDFSFIIDCSLDFLEQVRREKIKKIDFILQTHAHMDAMGGLANQLKEWIKENNDGFIVRMPVYVEKEAWDKIKERISDTEHIEPRFFAPYAPFTANGEPKMLSSPKEGIGIYPFRIIHSIQPGFPTSGFRFKDIVYSEDVGEIPKESERYYKNADTIIFDAAMWFDRFIKGHYNVEMALNEAKKYKPRLFILTQAGHTYPSQDKAEKEIHSYWEKIKDVKTIVKLAYDGLSIESKTNVSINLTREFDGIYLVYPHGRMIWDGEKTLIVKSKLFRNAIGRTFYVLERDRVYGLIKIKPPYKINPKEFDNLKDKHKITDTEKKKWWPFKQVLFAYPFEIVEKFDIPKKVEIPRGVQTFVKDFKFLEQELIQDVSSYDPEKMQTDVLRDDFRIIMAWYSSKKQGKSMIHSFEVIEDLAKKIYKELKKRGIKFHPDKMMPNSLDLFNKIADKEDKMEKVDEKQNKFDLTSYKLLEDFKDMTIIKDFVSVIGSYAEQRPNHVPNDIDLLIRMSKPPEFIRRAVEVRMLKHLGWPEDWQNKIHFVWGDPEGPHDSFIPMYDLVLKKQSPMKKIEMLDKNVKKWVSPEEYKEFNIDFYPMKPAHRFYDVNEALKYMFSVSDKFAIEKKYNGFRGVLEKKGDSVNIYSDQRKDISRNFKTIISQADSLSSKDVILDGELVLKGGGRAEIAKFITGKEELDDSQIEFHAFDIIKLDEDVSDMPWHERKSLLHGLNFTKNIREVRSVIVFKPDQARKAIELTRNLPKSEGAMIKLYDGKYTKGQNANAKSSAWIKFRNEDPINVVILEVIPKENGYTYKIGINVSEDKDKFKPDYLSDGILVLGDTFVTKQKFEKGDKITVNVEEVWRHKYSDNTIRYSIHKPSVIGPAKDISPWTRLDDLAVSKGEEVIEHSEIIENAEKEKCVDFFSKWTQDMAYILGYATCDAYIYHDKERVEFTSKDRQLLELIQEKLGLQNEEIRKVEGEISEYYVLRHVSAELVDRLVELGFANYKEDRTTYTKVPEEYANDYIRGVADADGTYDEERNKLQIDTSNHGLAKYVYNHLKKIGGDGVHIYKYAKEMRKIAVTSNTDEVVKWIYKDGKSFLKRKKKEAIKIQSDTTTETPGVSDVQGVKWIKKKLPIQKQNFIPSGMSIPELNDMLKSEAKKYHAIKSGEEKGSLENTILIGKIIYDAIIERNGEVTLPEEFKDYLDILKKGETGIMQKVEDEPREAIANAFWLANWQNMYPESGHGQFVYHHHFRGLTEDEIKMSNDELLNTDHSVHGDLRFEINPKKLFGFTVFTGTAKDNKEHGGDKLIYESENKTSKSKLQGTFKLEIPHSWLYVGRTKQGTVSAPSGVGATSLKYAKFFALDWGEYDIGVCREHMREIFFKGNKLKGRAIIAFAPVGGARKWLIDYPVDQTPYADSHKIEDVIKELKQKNQKWLIWASPNKKPVKIDVEKWSEEKNEDVGYRTG